MTSPGATSVEPTVQLGDIVERVIDAGSGDQVSVGELLDGFGHRSFGPLILTPSILVASPLSVLPGFPTAAGAVIALIAVQMLLGRRSPWLPGSLRRRRIDRRRLRRAAARLQPIARRVDRLVRPRLEFLTTGPFARAIAAICVLIALTMPPLELVPMANSTTGAAISVFGLALAARDGLLALLALGLTVAGAAIAAGALL